MKLLAELKGKRDTQSEVSSRAGFVGSELARDLCAAACAAMPNIRRERVLGTWADAGPAPEPAPAPSQPAERGTLMVPKSLKLRAGTNPTKSLALGKLLLAVVVAPLLCGMLLAVGSSTILGVWRGIGWVSPISEVIIQEAKLTLPHRLLNVHDQVEATLERCTNSLGTFAPAIEDAWNHHHNLSVSTLFNKRTPTVAWMPCTSPQCAADTVAARASASMLTAQQNPRGSTAINLNFGAVYRNGAKWNASSYTNPFVVDAARMGRTGSVYKESVAMARSDSVARAVYLSSELVQLVYFALEGSESMRYYPCFAAGGNSYTTFGKYKPWRCARGGSLKVGYSPLCRGWYNASKAKFDEADLNGNGRLEGATELAANVAMFSDMYTFAGGTSVGVTLSRAIVDNTGAFVGVAALDLSVNRLKAAVSKTVYERGYVMLASKAGNAVIHPKIGDSTAATMHLSEIEFFCGEFSNGDGEFDKEGADAFRESIAPRIFKEMSNNAGQSGSRFEAEPAEGIVEYQRCGEPWLLTWRQVDGLSALGDPFMLLLTVPRSDITAAPDRIERELTQDMVWEAMMGLVVFIVVATVCVRASKMFAEDLGKPLTQLSEYIENSQRAHFSGEAPVVKSRDPSREQLEIFRHFDNLLVALRFGTPKWAGGDKRRELVNYDRALALVTSDRGRGVCQTMRGQTARGMEAARNQEHLLARLSGAPVPVPGAGRVLKAYYDAGGARSSAAASQQAMPRQQAVPEAPLPTIQGEGVRAALAEAVELAEQAPNVDPDTVAGRRLNLAMWHVDAVVLRPQGKTLTDVSEHAQTAATLLRQAVENGSTRTVASVCTSLAPYPHTQLPDGLCDAWAALALATVDAAIDPTFALYLASVAKGANPELAGAFDNVVARNTSEFNSLDFHGKSLTWEQGAVQSGLRVKEGQFGSSEPSGQFGNDDEPKALCFAIDVSGSMAGGRIKTCKEALASMIDTQCSEKDQIGLLSFNSRTDIVFDILPKAGNEVLMGRKIAGLSAGGGTAFYDAIEATARVLSHKGAGVEKWVVALTDGADGSSRHGAVGNCCKLLNTQPGMNIALIVVGNETDMNNANRRLPPLNPKGERPPRSPEIRGGGRGGA